MRKLFLLTFMILVMCSSILAQKKVSGTVTDNLGYSIPNVTINVKGTSIGTLTDFEGKYTIEIIDETTVLVYNLIGMETIEKTVGNQITINIILEREPLPNSMPEENYVTVPVYFASDRNLTSSKEPNEMFGGKRSNVSYGICEVSIPRDHKMGELEKASILKFEFRNDPEKHVMLLSVQVNSKLDFFNKLKKRINDSPEKNAFVFVHGYNVSFEDASRRTAQMYYDLGFAGAPVFYSWPSQATLLGYNIDQGNIEWSQSNIKRFLLDFLSTSNAQNIYLIAHSMGNRGLTRALASIIKENPNATKRIKEIILAAPDIDSDVFKNDIAPVLIKCKKPITLYTSSNDLALAASKKFSNYPRAGQAGNAMIIFPGIDTIDASNVETDFLGHSYFGDSLNILSDIYNIMKYSQRPNDRFGLRKINREGKFYWEIKR